MSYDAQSQGPGQGGHDVGSRAHACVFVHMSAGECALLPGVDIYIDAQF